MRLLQSGKPPGRPFSDMNNLLGNCTAHSCLFRRRSAPVFHHRSCGKNRHRGLFPGPAPQHRRRRRKVYRWNGRSSQSACLKFPRLLPALFMFRQKGQSCFQRIYKAAARRVQVKGRNFTVGKAQLLLYKTGR